jgi:hypothetical protein
LFNAGLFFVPENEAAIYHQTQEDAGEAGWRDAARAANDGIIQAKIPHRFYRKSQRGYIYDVPKVSWIVAPTVADRVPELWEQIGRQTFTDSEVLFLGGDPAVDRFGELLAADPRVTVVPPAESADAQLVDALRQSRGEYVALLHGWASLDHRLLGRAVRRLDANPRASVARVGYQVITGVATTSYIYDDAVEEIDAAWHPQGLPVFALVRRREFAKVLPSGAAPRDLWKQVVSLSGMRPLRDGLVAVPALSATGPLPDAFPGIAGERTHFVNDVTKGGPRQAVRAMGRMIDAQVRRRPYRPVGLNTPAAAPPPAAAPRPGRPGVNYIGWLGRENFGDEAMLLAVRRLIPEAVVDYEANNARLLMLGGGTLINRITYLESLQRHDSPRVERAIFGAGVADPAYWGLTEPTEQWVDFLETCAYVGVRGPRSAELLREWGYDGELEVVGDPGLSVHPGAAVPTEEGLVVLSPAWTRGELFGEDDAAVFTAFAGLAQRVEEEGRTVAYLSCSPTDDRFIMQIMDDSGTRGAEYVAAYADHDRGVDLLARAEAVIAERLHAAVIAAACGTSFVAVEYRPKVRDFAKSIDQEDYVVRSDAVTSAGLHQLLREVLAEGVEQRLLPAVRRYQARQEKAAQLLRQTLRD